MVRDSFKNGWWRVPVLAAVLTIAIGTAAYIWTQKDLDVVRIEKRIVKIENSKVDKCVYEVQMDRVEADVQEIKTDIKAQRKTLEQIRIMIARDQ